MLPAVIPQNAQGFPFAPLRRLGPDPPAPEKEASPDPPAPLREASRSPRKHARGRTNISRHAMDSFATRMDKIEHQLDRVNDRFAHINKTLADLQTSNTELGEEIKKSASSKPTNDARPAASDILDLIKKLSAAADAQKSVDGLASRTATIEKTLAASIEAQTKRLDNYTKHLLQVEKLYHDDHGRIGFWAKELANVEKLCRDCSDHYNKAMVHFKVQVEEAFKLTYARFNESLHGFCGDLQAIRAENMRTIADQMGVDDSFSTRISSLNRRLYEVGLERGRLPEKGVGSTTAARLDYLDVLPLACRVKQQRPVPSRFERRGEL